MSFGLRLNWPAVHRPLLDVVLLGILLVLSENFKELWDWTTQRGFFCDDESLMYPYHSNTVSSSMLHWLGLYLPLLLLLILESCRCRRPLDSKWQQYWPVYNTLRWFLFGHVASSVLKNMGKHTIGRLRPHFFDICRPQLADGGFCTDDAHRQGGVYHTVYTCVSGADTELIFDAHISFPSGHSSMAFYGLVFVALHLQRIRRTLPDNMLRPLCQLVCVSIASFVGLSRVMDYKHHWSDVVAGSLLGTLVALAVVRAAEQEHRLHLLCIDQKQQQQQNKQQQNANTMAPQTVAVDKVVTSGSSQTEPASAACEVGQQLPQDLSVVTCLSSN
ncbi:putative phosphatidate phosphatase [Drosophila grimshawi]|uniref:GH16696 n=1 Tax=Drosophila grimshawi TaxID=7222 RepID=B4J313_DROGR|nr:putative phosphatidate phosphatase [Drosophila grimshawi]EDV97183.1 GH16696 [Drosophila grimshawi]